MTKDQTAAKLAIILHADVAGSTKMVQQDEHLAHKRIQESFRLFSETIHQYTGHVLELRGDALLAEFDRPSNAISATLVFQAKHSEILAALDDDLKPQIRVGIAMGEVVVADNTVTGAGVILAQRIEQLADAGGLCISSAVHESLSKRLPVEISKLGEQTLKGFEEPVRVFSVKLKSGESVAPQGDPMSEKRALRKLSAIFSADAKGYSRLMQVDESSTVQILKAYHELISSIIQEYRGRVVDSPGDNVLAEFASVVDAVESAVEIQKQLEAKNEVLPEDRRMEFRIGINLGDVIEEGEKIYGDGINIAARIEGLAEGGGICISGTAYDQIGRKLALGYEFMGEQMVKNIEKPIRVYRVLMKPEVAGMVIGEEKAKPRGSKGTTLVVAAMLVLVGIAAAIWNLYLRSALYSVEFASKSDIAIPMSEKPSIAVFPFKNLSGAQEQEYFSDGITIDIITDLSKFSELFVIASNSVFVYKGKPIKAQTVHRELGVRYILEGSVQRASEKVRVNAQLIEATTGHHIWAERYDRDLKDLFAVQDEIVHMIVATLAVKIDAEERVRVMRKDTQSLEAYDYVLRGWEHFLRSTRSANIQSRQMFEKAIELDSRYATAYVGLGQTHLTAAAYGWTEFSNQAVQRAHDLAQKALSLDDTSASAHALLGAVYRFWMQYDLAIKEYERAIELNPNDANSHSERGAIMSYNGQTDKAIEALEIALRFNPHMESGFFNHLGLAYYLKGRYDDAIGTLERGLSQYPDLVFLHIPLAAAYAKAGRLQDAARVAAKVRRLDPFFEVDYYGTAFINPDHRAKIADGLREAGL